jgi:hypothetical protein
LKEGCTNCTQRGNLSAILLKKVKFKNKNQKAINRIVIKTFRGSSPKTALSIHTTTNSPSQSRETVPLNLSFFTPH